MASVTVVERVIDIASAEPDRAAVVVLDHRGTATTTSYRELDHRANHCARVLAAHGVRELTPVIVALPNGVDHVIAALAVWKLGATVVALNPHSAAREIEETVDAVRPSIMLVDVRRAVACPVLTPSAWGTGVDPRPLRAPSTPPRSALATSGSTGRPRVVMRRRSWVFDADELIGHEQRAMGLDLDQTQLVCLPLHHGGFGALHQGLAFGHRIVLMSLFAPRVLLDAVERYAVQVMRLAPVMMRLLLDHPDVAERDMSSVRAVHHGTGPCPPEVKRAWLNLVGPTAVFEAYSSQEQLGFVWIRGDEWLEHPGSVGRPAADAVRILGPDRRALPPGEVGEIFFRSTRGEQPEYLGGGTELENVDGYLSVGDLGFLDADGYLRVVGRADDTINVGGSKVDPGEIEEVLTGHPRVLDACVVSRPDPIRGELPHAFLVVASPAPSTEELDERCRLSLSPFKVPARYEVVDSLQRNEVGKLQRWRWRRGTRY